MQHCTLASMNVATAIMRALASVIVFAAAALSGPAPADNPTTTPRIGVLPLANVKLEQALRQGLSALGYIEGKNIPIDWLRPAETNEERLHALARKFADSRVDVNRRGWLGRCPRLTAGDQGSGGLCSRRPSDGRIRCESRATWWQWHGHICCYDRVGHQAPRPAETTRASGSTHSLSAESY
jgi:hypothetical protein